MQIGYSTWGMPKVPIGEAIPAIAKLGYTGVEVSVCPRWSTALPTLDTGKRKEIRRLVSEHDLALTSVVYFTSMCEDDPEENARNMQSMRDAVDLAVDLAQADGPPFVVISTRGRYDEWEAKKEIVAERLPPLAEYAAQRGVTLAVEPHCGTLLDRPERILWLLERVNHPAVRLNFDVSHMEVMGIGINESVPPLAPHAVCTHVKDQRGIFPDHEFLTPGEGPFDFVRYLKAMQAAGYDDFITVEVSVHIQHRPDYDPFEHAKLAYWTLRKAFMVAGIDYQRQG